MAVDSAGTIHVAHGTSDDVLNDLTSSSSSSFGTPVVLATGEEDVGAAMALDAQGRAHVIYNDELTAQTLTFCCSSMISAAAAPDGALQIAHWDVAANRLRVTRVCPDQARTRPQSPRG